MPQERVQKILAQSGIGSRRYCESLIEAGQVTVNSHAIRIGAKADPETDEIRLNGELIRPEEEKLYILLNKPRGVLSSSRSQGGRSTVLDLVDIPTRVFPVGRLDLDSQGMLIFTNDGALANQLMHPRYAHEKEYRVLLDMHPSADQIRMWRKGFRLDNGVRTQSAIVRLEKRGDGLPWLQVILREGRKRQIREVANLLGLTVQRLIRVRIGPLKLGRLKSGSWRYLTKSEVDELRRIRTNPINNRVSRSKGASKDRHQGKTDSTRVRRR